MFQGILNTSGGGGLANSGGGAKGRKGKKRKKGEEGEEEEDEEEEDEEEEDEEEEDEGGMRDQPMGSHPNTGVNSVVPPSSAEQGAREEEAKVKGRRRK